MQLHGMAAGGLPEELELRELLHPLTESVGRHNRLRLLEVFLVLLGTGVFGQQLGRVGFKLRRPLMESLGQLLRLRLPPKAMGRLRFPTRLSGTPLSTLAMEI